MKSLRSETYEYRARMYPPASVLTFHLFRRATSPIAGVEFILFENTDGVALTEVCDPYDKREDVGIVRELGKMMGAMKPNVAKLILSNASKRVLGSFLVPPTEQQSSILIDGSIDGDGPWNILMKQHGTESRWEVSGLRDFEWASFGIPEHEFLCCDLNDEDKRPRGGLVGELEEVYFEELEAGGSREEVCSGLVRRLIRGISGELRFDSEKDIMRIGEAVAILNTELESVG
ncbi:hypothetical protein BJ742DRAFT_765573 [Cladochytrium replicatum]|nr:hypothetical protein BJ742DRAFT_765573 [Cladochytrium replicatum]